MRASSVERCIDVSAVGDGAAQVPRIKRSIGAFLIVIGLRKCSGREQWRTRRCHQLTVRTDDSRTSGAVPDRYK